MSLRIIGVDCAVDDSRVGLALATVNGSSAILEQVTVGSRRKPIRQTIHAWIAEADQTLIALDAPLGWPAPLAASLASHTAGAALDTAPHSLFRRETDVIVKQLTGKQSLDVGADRIARTAYAALALLQDLRDQTAEPIPLVWSSAFSETIGAIEVYPAATIASYGIAGRRYKRPDDLDARRAVASFLATRLDLRVDVNALIINDHALDAALCCLAGLDFLNGTTVPPSDVGLAHKEGWIWVRGRALNEKS